MTPEMIDPGGCQPAGVKVVHEGVEFPSSIMPGFAAEG